MAPKRTCSIEGCEKTVKSYGYCSMHAARYERHGDPFMVKNDNRCPPIVRWMARISPQPNGCWLWTGKKRNTGYAVMKHGGSSDYAHRFAYEFFVGPIPDDLELDHLCSTKACVNPDHLEAVTHAENCRRAYPQLIAGQRAYRIKRGFPR